MRCYSGQTHIFVAVHTQTLNLVNDLGVVLILLSTRFVDLAAHILEEVLRETLVFGHFVVCIIVCNDSGCGGKIFGKVARVGAGPVV